MFFGHLLFVYDQDINKYSIYVHFQEEWNSYPVNILFDVTNVWSNPNFSNYTYSTDFFYIHPSVVLCMSISLN